VTGTTRSPEQARLWLEARGIVTSDWARQNGFSPELVYGVLTGRLRGRRGQAHEIAVALGVKAAPPSDAPDGLPDSNTDRNSKKGGAP